MKMVICAAYGCYNRSDKGKGKVISFFSIPNPRIKPEKEAFSSRMAIQNWDRMDSEELLI